MAHVVYYGVQTASLISGVSNKLVASSVELCVTAASTALRTLRANEKAPVPEHPLVRDELAAMDIEAKLKTVQALVLTIQKTRKNKETPDDSDVVGVCVSQVKDVLESITTTLNSLNQELEEHDNRWFSTWRTPDTKHLIVALRAKVLVLDKRVDMLLKVRSFIAGMDPAALQEITEM